MKCYCGKSNCRGEIHPHDLLIFAEDWDKEILPAIKNSHKVEQPLMHYVDHVTKNNLSDFLKTGKNFSTVKSLYFDRVKVYK